MLDFIIGSSQQINMTSSKKDQAKEIGKIDSQLSMRYISLDPKGYFLIKVDSINQVLIAELYTNDIDSQGRSIDPESGEAIGCKQSQKRSPIKIYKARSAKEIGIQLTEKDESISISRLDHALYLGRELQKAELCLINGTKYIQD